MYYKFTLVTRDPFLMDASRRLAFESAVVRGGYWRLAKVARRGEDCVVILETDEAIPAGLFKDNVYNTIVRIFLSVFGNINIRAIKDIQADYTRPEDSKTRRRRPEDIIENLVYGEDLYEYNEFMVCEEEKEERRKWAKSFLPTLEVETRPYDLFFAVAIQSKEERVEDGHGEKVHFPLCRILSYLRRPTAARLESARGDIAAMSRVEKMILARTGLDVFTFSNYDTAGQTLLRGVCRARSTRQATEFGLACLDGVRAVLADSFAPDGIKGVRLVRAREVAPAFGTKEEVEDYGLFLHRVNYGSMFHMEEMASMARWYKSIKRAASICGERRRRKAEFSQLRGVIKREFASIATRVGRVQQDDAFPSVIGGQ